MSRNRITKSIAFEPEIFEALEQQRTRQYRSPFINEMLREKLGLKK
jgi:hypothetical protein